MKEVLKRGFTSFALSSFAGLIVNLIIDIIMNARGLEGFSSMSPDYVALFPSVTIAAYVNILLYGVIGATFAPVLLSCMGGAFGITFFIVQWAVIITGVTLVSVFGPTKLRFIHIPLYVILGWSALMLMPAMIAFDVWLALFILFGGIAYTLGIIPYAIKARVSHFIWHLFVLIGAAVQWVGIFVYIYLK